jgi:hypothetical protein
MLGVNWVVEGCRRDLGPLGDATTVNCVVRSRVGSIDGDNRGKSYTLHHGSWYRSFCTVRSRKAKY